MVYHIFLDIGGKSQFLLVWMELPQFYKKFEVQAPRRKTFVSRAKILTVELFFRSKKNSGPMSWLQTLIWING